ncbi:hypothetical protein [Bauldia sp.]|uniref:hypothetical protein n=1 Tax=Bauldia sp. TaxID=2575872 RepID=UPI003BAD99E1
MNDVCDSDGSSGAISGTGEAMGHLARQPVSILDVEPLQCRFVVSGEGVETLFCGAPLAPGHLGPRFCADCRAVHGLMEAFDTGDDAPVASEAAVATPDDGWSDSPDDGDAIPADEPQEG